MMQRRHFVRAAAMAAGSSAFGAAFAQPGAAFTAEDLLHAERLRDMGRNDGEAWALVQQLVNDVGARPAGSAADAKAAVWAQAALRRLGLQNVRAETTPMKMWQRGPASARLVAPVAEPLVMAALGNSVAAPEGGIEADIAWYADFATLKADTSDRARGKIVFIDQKTERTRDGAGYGAAVGARSGGAIEAARRGALAVAIRSIGTSSEQGDQRIAHTGAMRYDVGQPRIPAFAISVPDADRLAALQAQGQTLRLQFTLASKSDVPATTQNVIGEITGTELPEEIVLIGAHLDSWDLGPGAIDDGAGVAIVSAAAALVQRAGQTAKQRPRRTIRVVLFGNEENGFEGAMSYADRYKAQTHQLVSESDFGAGRVWQLRGRVQPQALPLVEVLAQTLAPLGVTWPDRGRNEGSTGPDANFLMRRNRWPAIGLNQEGANYFDVHHTAHDTLDRIHPPDLSQNTACWAVMAWLAAQSPLPFGPPVL